jgi:serine phosphatase RsbU (regulator of sigma subunit)
VAGDEGLLDMARRLLALGHVVGFEGLPDLVEECGALAGLMSARVFVADLRNEALCEMTGRGPDAGEGGTRFPIDGSQPGSTFADNHPLREPAGGVDGADRWWVPILDGTERLGVLRVDPVPRAGEDSGVREAARMLASLVALMLVSKRASSDAYARLTRRRRMTVAAELEWNLMPPLAFANNDVVIAAAAEPAYDIGGDAFDYSVAGRTAHLAVFDAMGHDSSAGLTASVAVAAFRNLRRQGAGLVAVGEGIEKELVDQFGGSSYATAVLAELDLSDGVFCWVSRGHPPPIVIRHGRWVTGLECEPAHPLGMNLGLEATVCQEQLAPGDRIVLYTDGITEARDRSGREFGVARFIEFLNRHQAEGLPVPETLRRLMQAIIALNRGQLSDDASVLCLEWRGSSRNLELRPNG